jgi:protein-tyrosine-phosphatase
MTPKRKLSILFVCIGNSCRSPMAEGIARHEAGDFLQVASAGLAPLGSIASLTLQTLQKNGYPPDSLSSKPILRDAWDSADLVINLSGYSRERAFADCSKVEDWEVEDPYGADPAVYQRIFEDIQARVLALIERLRAQAEAQP